MFGCSFSLETFENSIKKENLETVRKRFVGLMRGGPIGQTTVGHIIARVVAAAVLAGLLAPFAKPLFFVVVGALTFLYQVESRGNLNFDSAANMAKTTLEGGIKEAKAFVKSLTKSSDKPPETPAISDGDPFYKIGKGFSEFWLGKA